jgi:hypothetical protein
LSAHRPWPKTGCSLSEARERTVDRVRWAKWKYASTKNRIFDPKDKLSVQRPKSGRTAEIKPAAAYEEMINAAFLQHMKDGRLVAFGEPRKGGAPQLIARAPWAKLTMVEWENSTARNGQIVFRDVRVYPRLLAPCRVDLLAGRSLAAAFNEFVLKDPEFVALAHFAIQTNDAARPMLEEGQFPRDAVFGRQWPVSLEAFPSFAKVLNDAQTWSSGRTVIGEKSEKACEVLRHRYEHLLRLLRDGLVLASGTYEGSGKVERIDAAQWSRRPAWIDPASSDFLEEANNKLVPRWTGVSLAAPARPKVQKRDTKFKPASPHRKTLAKLPPRPIADAVATALRAIGLETSPGPHTFKSIAARIVDKMPNPPKTAQQLESLAKAVSRHYQRLTKHSP